MNIHESLIAQQDSGYKAFQSKLVPNIDPNTILGVRTPALRSIAKEAFGTEEARAFLAALPHDYYEENLLHFFLIARIRDFDECVRAVEAFLPYVDCWPVSDQATPGCFRKNRDRLLPCVKKWIESEQVYTARFGMRMLMNEYLDDAFKAEYLEWVAVRGGEDYYLKMMAAWFFATALAKQYDAAVTYLEERRLEPWIHQKAIQKAVESYRVSEAHKAYLKSLRTQG